MNEAPKARTGRGTGFYMMLFVIAAVVLSALRVTDAINPGTAYLLFLASMGFIVLAVRATARQHSRANTGAAIIRYGKGMAIASFAYVLGLGAAITINRTMDIAGVTAFGVALLPVLPIFYMIYVMGRYLVEEQDEYLRHRATIAALVGLACVLGLSSMWGFLENFELVPHLQGWWSVPIWAVGMGLAQGWMSLRDRAGDEA